MKVVSRLIWDVVCYELDEEKIEYRRKIEPRLFMFGPHPPYANARSWRENGRLRFQGGLYIVDWFFRPGIYYDPEYTITPIYTCEYPGYSRQRELGDGKVMTDFEGKRFYLRLRDDVREVSSYTAIWGAPVYVVENSLGDRIRLVTLAAYIYKVLREERGRWVDWDELMRRVYEYNAEVSGRFADFLAKSGVDDATELYAKAAEELAESIAMIAPPYKDPERGFTEEELRRVDEALVKHMYLEIGVVLGSLEESLPLPKKTIYNMYFTVRLVELYGILSYEALVADIAKA